MIYSMNDFDYWDDAGLSGFLSKAWKKVKKVAKKVQNVVTAPLQKVLEKVGVYDDLKEFESKHRDDLKKLGAVALTIATAGAAGPVIAGAIGPTLSSGLAAAQTFVSTNLAAAGAALKTGAITAGKKALAAVSVDNIKKKISDKAKDATKQALGRTLTSAENLLIEQGTSNDVDAQITPQLDLMRQSYALQVPANPVLSHADDVAHDNIKRQMIDMRAVLADNLHVPGAGDEYDRLARDIGSIDGKILLYQSKQQKIPNYPITNHESLVAYDMAANAMDKYRAILGNNLHLPGIGDEYNRLEWQSAKMRNQIREYQEKAQQAMNQQAQQAQQATNQQAQQAPNQQAQSKSNTGLLIGGGLLLASMLLGG